MMTPTNVMCGTMGSPDAVTMLKHIRHMHMHMLSKPFGKRYGGSHLSSNLSRTASRHVR